MNILELKSREISQTTCQRIGRLRKSSGMSLSALAQQTRLNERYLERVENHQSDPSLRCLIRIARAFGVDVLFLITGAGSGKSHHAPADRFR